jgi:hypothetical protein
MLLFPLYIRTVDETTDSRTVRDRILWWLYSDTRETGRDGDTRRLDAWPVLHYERDREGATSLRVLALLEAMLPGNEWVERNYAPLWSLYTARSDPQGARVHSFLWNLLRHEETPAGRSIEVLGPLLRYRQAEDSTELGFLGGLLHYELHRGVRTVRLFGRPAISWREQPQAVAGLPSEEGGR